MSGQEKMNSLERDWLVDYPQKLVTALAETARRTNSKFYVTGGSVRDWLNGKMAPDLDFTISTEASTCAALLARELSAALVPLDDQEGVARVVWGEYIIDICEYREGTDSIEADLAKRDFTINAMGVEFSPGDRGLLPPYTLIDPLGGFDDLNQKKIQATSERIFDNDPLRLLRAFRFSAVHGFTIDENTVKLATKKAALITKPSPERILRELEMIVASPRASVTFEQMADADILGRIFPELLAGCGVEQPACHHLDVFGHNLAAFKCMAEIIAAPDVYFPENARRMNDYLRRERRVPRLMWAALFHDIAKPAQARKRQDRLTFYNHDRQGGRMFTDIGRRLRFSNKDIKEISRFIEMHMWPFHLQNSLHKTGIKPRACLKFVKAAEEERHGLFLLAMADSLAARGEGKSAAVEEGLVKLYNHIEEVYQQSIKPVLETPPLINGNDLINLGFEPGPQFRDLLESLEQEQVEGRITNREEAVAWLERLRR